MHDGHRERLRERFLREGLDSFEDHNILELLLFYVIPRKDTNELAHLLLDRFGSLSAVLEAPYEELKTVPGIGELSASLLCLIPEISRKYLGDKYSDHSIVDSTQRAGDFLMDRFVGRNKETVILLLLDAKGRVLYCGVIAEGSVNATEVNVKRIVETSARYNASSAILSHNHPSGIALPSKQDLDTTEIVKDALCLINVELVDHIIVADRDFVSLAECGMLGNKNTDRQNRGLKLE